MVSPLAHVRLRLILATVDQVEAKFPFASLRARTHSIAALLTMSPPMIWATPQATQASILRRQASLSTGVFLHECCHTQAAVHHKLRQKCTGVMGLYERVPDGCPLWSSSGTATASVSTTVPREHRHPLQHRHRPQLHPPPPPPAYTSA
jgi:hypothetical protein